MEAIENFNKAVSLLEWILARLERLRSRIEQEQDEEKKRILKSVEVRLMVVRNRRKTKLEIALQGLQIAKLEIKQNELFYGIAQELEKGKKVYGINKILSQGIDNPLGEEILDQYGRTLLSIEEDVKKAMDKANEV